MKKGKMVCRECGKNTTYRLVRESEKCSECNCTRPEHVFLEDSRRVRAQLCPSCFRKELKIQLFDEVAGILGNWSITPEPETLVDLAKVLVRSGKTKYYQASEYMVFQALKDNQDPDGMFGPVLMLPDGDKSRLSKKVVK